MNKTKMLLFAGLAAVAMVAGQAYACPVDEFSEPPPPGWVLNLNSQRNYNLPGPHYVEYTAYFTATQTMTYITFALTDSTFDDFFLDNIAVANIQSPDVNLIRNGGFEDGIAPSGGNASAPVDWQYLNPYHVSYFYNSSVGCSGDGHSGYGQGGSSCAWFPDFAQAYDFITQPIATSVFDTYQISFWAQGPDEGNHWIGRNGACCWPEFEGDSFNIVVYAGNNPPVAVPEPAALGMFGFGVLLIGGFVMRRRREQRQA